MKMFQYLKPSFVLAIAACSLWSCNNEEGKSRYFAVKLDGEERFSILDTKSGEVLCKNDFKSTPESVDNGLFAVRNSDGYYEVFDVDNPNQSLISGKWIQIGNFFAGNNYTFAVKEGKAISIINKNFEEVKVLPKSITMSYNFTDGLAAFCKDGKWGFLNEDGEEVIKAKYDSVWQFKEGLTWANKGDKVYLIDKNGEVVKSFNKGVYSPLTEFSDGLAALSKDDKVVFVDKKGEVVLSNSKLKYGYYYSHHYGVITYYDGDNWGLMDTEGNIIVKARYNSIAYVCKDRYIAQKDDKWGAIDAKGDTVIDFDYVGIAQNSTENSLYFILNDKNKVLLINESGDEICKEEFSDVNFNVTNMFYSDVERVEFEEEPTLSETTVAAVDSICGEVYEPDEYDYGY